MGMCVGVCMCVCVHGACVSVCEGLEVWVSVCITGVLSFLLHIFASVELSILWSCMRM